MKKIISLTGIIAMAALTSTTGYAAKDTTAAAGTEQQAAYDNTAGLRSSLAADQVELNALMLNDNPDPKRARELAANISKTEDELGRLLGTGGYMGRGCGVGYGHHMAQNMNGHHMMGN